MHTCIKQAIFEPHLNLLNFDFYSENLEGEDYTHLQGSWPLWNKLHAVYMIAAFKQSAVRKSAEAYKIWSGTELQFEALGMMRAVLGIGLSAVI